MKWHVWSTFPAAGLGMLMKVEGSQRNKEKPWRKIWFSLQKNSDRGGDLFFSSAGVEAAKARTDEPHRSCQAHKITSNADHLHLDLLQAVHLWPEEDPPGSWSQVVYLLRWEGLWWSWGGQGGAQTAEAQMAPLFQEEAQQGAQGAARSEANGGITRLRWLAWTVHQLSGYLLRCRPERQQLLSPTTWAPGG